jgi:hypothetical protein
LELIQPHHKIRQAASFQPPADEALIHLENIAAVQFDLVLLCCIWNPDSALFVYPVLRLPRIESDS